MAHDIRFDAFKNIWEPRSIANEVATIPDNSPYRIRLLEVAQKTSPSTLIINIADKLAAGANASQTTLAVSNGPWFAVNDVIVIDSEYLLVTAVSGNTLTVARGHESTTPVNHSAGADVVISPSMSEVAAAPGRNQFWPDYNTPKGLEEGWNTGTIEFNAADAGKRLLVNYMGIGTLADRRIITSRPTSIFNAAHAPLTANLQAAGTGYILPANNLNLAPVLSFYKGFNVNSIWLQYFYSGIINLAAGATAGLQVSPRIYNTNYVHVKSAPALRDLTCSNAEQFARDKQIIDVSSLPSGQMYYIAFFAYKSWATNNILTAKLYFAALMPIYEGEDI